MSFSTPLSKAAELECFMKLLADLPAGYVREILTEAIPFIEQEMRNDFATHGPISGLLDAKRDAMAELKTVMRAVADAKDAVKVLESEISRLNRSYDAVKSEIRTLARCAGF